MKDIIRQFRTMITRAVIDTLEQGMMYRVRRGGDQIQPGVEHREPQGVHFRLPDGCAGIVFSPGAARAAGVLLGASGKRPSDSLQAGEGGLHYLGDWRVFVAADGTVALADRAPGDFAALASKTDAAIASLKGDIQTIVTMFNSWTPVLNDGGTALKSLATSNLVGVPHSPASVASAKVKIE